MTARLPQQGVPFAEIEAEMDALRVGDPDFSLTSLKGPSDVQQVALAAHTRFFNTNALLGARLPSLWRMQTDVLEMAVGLLRGGPDAKASMTTGGSESIFCAVHAAREWARERKPEIAEPELVVPYSAHAGFSKACHYLGIRLIRSPLRDDYRADVEAMERRIGPNTIGLVGSAPCWPYGLYDPIPEITGLAEANGLWMHVDACVGAFIAPFARKLGYELPNWDLSLSGVCSISADLHKYGFAPLPCSMVLYASGELHRYQPYVVEDWPTGPYRTETVVGSRQGGAVAAAWAIFRYLGEEGFVRTTARIMSVKERLTAGIDEIPGLWVLPNDLPLLAFGTNSDRFDTESVAKGLRERGWFVFGVKEPPLINMGVSAVDDDAVVERFLDDLAAIAAGFTEPARAAGELSYAS